MLEKTRTARVVLFLVAGLVGLSACRKGEDDSTRETPQLQDKAPVGRGSPSDTEAGGATSQSIERQAGKPETQVSAPGTQKAPAGDDALEAIKQQILENWSKIRSFSAKVKTTFDRLDGVEQHEIAEGTRDCLIKDDGTVLVRERLINKITYAREGDEEIPWVITGQVIRKVSDGRFVYTFDRTHAGTAVTKSFARSPRLINVGGNTVIGRLSAMKNVQRLRNEKMGMSRVYVFEGIARPDSTWRLYVAQKTGMLLKFVTENETKQSKFEFVLSEITFDVEFDEDHFVFTPPEGLEVQDLTIPGAGEAIYTPLP